ncbi:hypothetical protein PoB_003784400 [Plakobranchus ocellatus]|uniref:Uncharacterized protein n=1 Tax=Plakobranchus ocellatus TaxID=259542 RepID=A0AAV4AYY1_9GAST|nr:hypothetical protein PoB_003784400 [Plakobranchus ocellatus]
MITKQREKTYVQIVERRTLGQGCTQQFRNSTTAGRLLRLAYGRYPGLVVRQLAHVSTVSSPVRHTVTTWSLSHQAPVLVCVPSMSRQGHTQGICKIDCKSSPCFIASNEYKQR